MFLSFLTLLYLFFKPLFGIFEANDHIVAFFSQKSGPVDFFLKALSVAHDDKPMLGSCDANVDSILLLDELPSCRSHHRYKDKVEFTSLWTIDG